MTTALAEAIARLDARWGSRTVATATAADDRASAHRFVTDTAFDRISGGITAGSAMALTGEGTSGKVTLALRAAAGAQRDGGMVLWVDPGRSFDPVAARRAGIDLDRVIVVRSRTRDEIVLAAGAGLRSEGFRLVVVDLGPAFAAVASPDGLAPITSYVRGSTAALLVVSDEPAYRLAVPTFVFERVAWESQHDRTVGWTFAARRLGAVGSECALLGEAV